MSEPSGFALVGPRSRIEGRMRVPASKSLTNRALVAAAVCGGSRIVNPLLCDDTRFLSEALSQAGWQVTIEEGAIRLGPRQAGQDRTKVFLGGSGTGSRFILALLAASPGRYLVDGTPRLRQRPMGPLLEALETLGGCVRAAHGGFLPAEVDGCTMVGGETTIRPQVSSQFVSALVLAAPLFDRGLELHVAGPLPSAPYLDLTVDVLRSFRYELSVSDDRREWRLAGSAAGADEYLVEGDWSAAAFPMAAAAVAGGVVTIGPLERGSRQGDRVVAEVLERAGVEVRWRASELEIRGPVRRPIVADLSHCPDTFPALAAVAACRAPGSRLTGLEHLAHKESHRLRVMAENLEDLGAVVRADGDDFEVVRPVVQIEERARSVQAADDHRIAMAMAVTALYAGPLDLDDPSCVGKSFPDFWTEWAQLIGGGVVAG